MKIKPLLITVLKMSSKKSEKEMIAIIIPKITEIIPQMTKYKSGYAIMKDGVVAGYIDDHEFKLNSTTKELGNIEKPWNMNQQSVANGLGVNGSIIGVSSPFRTDTYSPAPSRAGNG